MDLVAKRSAAPKPTSRWKSPASAAINVDTSPRLISITRTAGEIEIWPFRSLPQPQRSVL